MMPLEELRMTEREREKSCIIANYCRQSHDSSSSSSGEGGTRD